MITASDIVVDAEDDEPLAATVKKSVDTEQNTTLKSAAADTDDNDVSVSKKRTGRRKSRIEAEVEDRDRSGSAPRKRVVSDGHWRKKRSPPRRVAPGQQGVDSVSSTPTKALPDDGVRVKATPDGDLAFQTEREGVEVIKRRRPKVDDGIRVYATPSESRRRSEHRRLRAEGRSRSRSGDNNDGEKASPGTSSSPPDRAAHVRWEKDREPKIGSSAAKEDSRRRKSTHKKDITPERSPKAAHGARSQRRNSGKPHKVSILSQVFDEPKKIFSKSPEPAPIPPPRIPTIEAWLSETPDPFVDGETPPIATPTPSRIGFIETKASREEVIHEDTNKIWDALGSNESGKASGDRADGRRRRRIRSAALYEDNPFPADLATEPPVDNPKTSSAAKLVDLLQDSVHPSPRPVEDERGQGSTITSSSTISSVEPCKPRSLARPPGLNRKRPFPSTGVHRLSTIASVETFQSKEANAVASSNVSRGPPLPSQPMDLIVDSEVGDTFDPNAIPERNTSLKRRLTTHADLISVLSVPRRGSKSIQSARSIRTNRSRLATATIGDLMKELSSDESKYIRELNTLVDGVIPVLLTCVLSKSDSVVAAGLFSPSANGSNDPSFTRPIVDMGIALERLKTLHKRIPLQDSRALLTWAQGAQRVYAEYIKAWRLGFQDVVVNLAPAQGDGAASPNEPGTQDKTLEDGLPRNKDGDVVNGDGERVDVAFLLKRPLVRLKYLSKTFKGINFIMPSPEADNLAKRYQNLVIDARRRLNEEQARMEDEAASNIDPTRARDPRTLAPLIGVTIDRTRRVRARDYFNLALQHSSGQSVDCRVELLLRDDAPEKGTSGDLLICEVDSTSRWLLFPPIQRSRVSARNGDLKGEIVTMVRGLHKQGLEWQESMALRTDEEAIGFEWVQMLGLTPVPPRIIRTQSFLDRQERRKSTTPSNSLSLLQNSPTTPVKSRTPSPREIDVPIGEQARSASKRWTPTQEKLGNEEVLSPLSIRSKERAGLQKSPKDAAASRTSSSPPISQLNSEGPRTPPSQAENQADRHSAAIATPASIDEAPRLAESGSSSGLRRAKAKRRSRHESPASPRSPNSLYLNQEPPSPSQPIQEIRKVDVTASAKRTACETDEDKTREPLYSHQSTNHRSISKDSPKEIRPSYHRRRSSVPSLELPSIPKIRKASPPTTPLCSLNVEPEWPVTPSANKPSARSPAKLLKRRSDKHDNEPLSAREEPPAPPVHRSPSPIQLKGSITPNLGSPKSASNTKQRSSSPLKHEYEPSTASESSSDSDASTIERHEVTSVSDSSSEEELEDGDTPTPLLPLGALPRIAKVSPQGSLYSLPNGTLTPSQSASQAPYKTVPAQPSKATKSIASIFSWSDKGTWESLHPDECSVVITPGLIEVLEMSAAHSMPANITERSETDSELSSISHERDKPLIAIELTPLVPLRRGTALDISVRSPPTPNSKITSSSNIMFRSRNPEECETLYAHFNHSRINNPTYIALQNARGPYSESYNATLNRRSSTRGTRSSWFGWGGSHKSSYRASSAPTPSIAASESSIGTMTTAFSALKRFGSTSRMFNIARSTITSRNGSRSNSIYSTDSSSGTSSPSPSPFAAVDLSKGSPLGINNAKIRLYARETASKWRDMGAARLTIMRPLNAAHPPPSAATGGSSPPGMSGGTGLSKAHGLHTGQEKRILVRGKTKGEVLLDVCLGESCFERVARTGIAMSVWEEVVGPGGVVGTVGAVGGVGGTRARVFMIQVRYFLSFLRLLLRVDGWMGRLIRSQMRSEAETAYTFSIVGKLRY